MAWTVPRTWGASDVVTAALLNEQIRDNLNETMCAKARLQGGFFTTLFSDDQDSDDDSVTTIVERFCASERIAAAEQTTSTTFTDLTTVGPTVTVETGQQALIFMSCTMFSTQASSRMSGMSWGISGATNRVTYFDPIILMQDGCTQASAPWNFSQADHMRGLTPGTNTFKCQYRCGSGAAAPSTFSNRFLAVFPL